MLTSDQSASHPPAARSFTCLELVIIGLLSMWIGLFGWLRLGVSLFTGALIGQIPANTGFMIQITLAGLWLLPLIPLALFWRPPGSRVVLRAWLGAALLVAILSPLALLADTAFQLQSAGAIGILIVTALLLSHLVPRHRLPLPGGQALPGRQALPEGIVSTAPAAQIPWLALPVAIIALYPWLAWGALGSLLDTILGLGLAFVLAWNAVLLWGLAVQPVQVQDAPLLRFLYSGMLGSIPLFLLTNALPYSYGGIQLLLAIFFPAIAWLFAALELLLPPKNTHNSQFPFWLSLSLLSAASLLFVDPDELALIISASAGETLLWGLRAAGVSLAICLGAIVLSLGVYLARKWLPSLPTWLTRLTPLAIFAFSVLGIVLFFLVGQPGLYGEGLFVILKSQSALPELSPDLNPEERRAAVYQILSAHADQTQENLRSELERRGLDYQPYYLVNAIQVQAGPRAHLWLKTHPDVDRVLANPWMRPLPQKPPAGSGDLTAPESPDWNLRMINAERVWQEFAVFGDGIVVGQSDSGADGSHPELSGSYRGADGQHDYNWYDPWFNSPAPTDIGGHGTHTLGTIVGENTGVAPGATWFACVNLARNLGNPALYLDCMQFMLAPFPANGDPLLDGDPNLGANVINNSWGCPPIEGCDSDSLLPAVTALRAAGIFVVASAGNDGPACGSLNTPIALYDPTFSIGAVDEFGTLTSFSSRGPLPAGASYPKPDLVAPGFDVLSSMPGGSYARMSGTSMAGPHVAGVVALLWSANPDLIADIATTEQILYQSAQPYQGPLTDCPGSDSYPSTAAGYGLVDAYAAVQAALELRTP